MSRTMVICGLFCMMLGPAVAQDSLEDINFPLNSSIVVDGFQGLDVLAAALAKHEGLDLEIVGHTDAIGTASYNKGLSQRRADSVKSYLVTKGVNAAKIKASGDGIDNSFDNKTREGRFQNRRVSLNLFETVNGLRSKVSYPRLLELLFGGPGGANMQSLNELKEEKDKDQGAILASISDLQKQLNAMNEGLQRRLEALENRAAAPTQAPASVNLGLQLNKYTGVSISAGADDDGEVTGQLRGLYFKTVGEHFAIQAQGDASYYDAREEGQADIAAVYQHGGFKLSAAGSYKWAAHDGAEAIRIAQGAVMADWRFETGKIGLFGTFPIADGDVIRTETTGVYTTEYFVSVPTQIGIDLGLSLGSRIDLNLYGSSLDTEVSDADFAAGLNFQMLIKDELSWYFDAAMNDGYLAADDDSMRYQLGLKFGSWNQARYNVSDQITPVNIPRVRYEILSRVTRTGNNTPLANAGQSRTDVPEGVITLDGSASSDPDGDTITYKWAQTSGPAVVLTGATTAKPTFHGVAGNSYTFQLTVRDSYGDTSTDAVSIGMEAAPIPAPVIGVFSATPSTIDLGELATLSWVTLNATQVSISHLGVVTETGQLVVSPSETTTYTLTATNETGTVTAEVTVTVNQLPPPPQPVISFLNAIPDTITEGEFTTLTWSALHADTVTLSGYGQVNAEGSLLMAPKSTTTYTLTATNAQGSVTATVTVTVNPIIIEPPNTDPVANAGIDLQVNEGEHTTLDGTGSFDPDGDALTYQWDQIGGPSVSLSGADTATPSFNALTHGDVYTFRLIVRDGRGGVSSDTVTVLVIKF